MVTYKEKVEELSPFYAEGSGPQKLAETTLKSLEVRLGTTLPDEYRSFLTNYGGVALLV